ncbi:hydrogenase expression/formation protein HypE [Halalkaliarchaeum desulfuricum]|uniref:Hydrogenase expression/formation protein HypE n=1 Tax=Halalkaliarchaeum desulfuricum TaxID=2055893 RepID=A0A343TI24_9EURY|nr:AIR synthase family protein [Halalkaliarchaeum desulfuricum]AUX08746.1 hydrogenase expression/formation protein HypE [Halalkaliarchaeum desulfuricum]
MSDTGKVDREFFESQIEPKLGATRDDVALGPKHGVDFGVVTVEDTAVVMATDPVSILPQLGFRRAGRFAVRIVLSDVAVSGLPPSHLSIAFTLPPSMSDGEFAQTWDAIHEECRDLGVSVVTGHTARYEGCSYPWVGGATAMAVGDPEAVVRPDGARPGDDLLVTRGPAVESAGLLSSLFPDAVDVDPSTLATVQSGLDDLDGVRDAVTAAAAGRVTAMHDVTEGGLVGALHEVARSGGVRLAVDTDAVPTQSPVVTVCEALGMDPWRATSAGTLVIAVDPDDTDDVVEALRERGTPVGIAGRVEAGSGVVVDGEETSPPDGDASWPVYERLLEE